MDDKLMGKNYRDESRKAYTSGDPGPFNQVQLRTGALLRIADALERMAQPYIRLLESTDWLKRQLAWESEEAAQLRRRLAAMRGVATKLRKAKNEHRSQVD